MKISGTFIEYTPEERADVMSRLVQIQRDGTPTEQSMARQMAVKLGKVSSLTEDQAQWVEEKHPELLQQPQQD
jgi:hypothetical protein